MANVDYTSSRSDLKRYGTYIKSLDMKLETHATDIHNAEKQLVKKALDKLEFKLIRDIDVSRLF